MFSDEFNHKLTVAKHHVETAVLLSGINADVRSIHVLAMAADDLILSVAGAIQHDLPISIESVIRPDKIKVWFRAKKKAYNFFKHADLDPFVNYDGPDFENLVALNDVILMQAIANLRSLGVPLAQTTDWFWRGVLFLNPHLVDWEHVPGAVEALAELTERQNNRDDLMTVVRAAAFRQGHLDFHNFSLSEALSHRIQNLL